MSQLSELQDSFFKKSAPTIDTYSKETLVSGFKTLIKGLEDGTLYINVLKTYVSRDGDEFSKLGLDFEVYGNI